MGNCTGEIVWDLRESSLKSVKLQQYYDLNHLQQFNISPLPVLIILCCQSGDQRPCGKLSVLLVQVCVYKCSPVTVKRGLHVNPAAVSDLTCSFSQHKTLTLASGRAPERQRGWRNLNPFNKNETDKAAELQQLKCKPSRSHLILPALLRSWRPWWLKL